MQTSELWGPISRDMLAVDAVIRARLNSDVALVSQIADYIIAAGGKRLRPVLLLLVSGALGFRGTKAHELAAVIEIIHTATLLHDDVVDESALRRGRRTANAVFGNAASVLVGDFLYSRAFQMMVGLENMRVMQILSDATNVIAEGEVLQLMNIGDADVSEERYMRVIQYKTAKLFEAAGRLGAIAARADETVVANMAEFGMRLGTAFQIIDDVLDYSGMAEETGKNTGDDLSEGKPTLPLIHVIRNGSDAERRAARAAINHPESADFPTILSAIESTGALKYAREVASHEAERAKELLNGLPPSECRETLLQLLVAAIHRSS